jgi:hypothetical protein
MRHAVYLSTISFVLHFGWESIQCPFFYVHGSYDVSWMGRVRASLGDVMITWAIFSVVAVVSMRWRWDSEQWYSRQWIGLTCTALALGASVEVRALETGRWMYEPAMPILPRPEVGLVPLLQLLVLSPVCIRLSEWLSTERRLRGTHGHPGPG